MAAFDHAKPPTSRARQHTGDPAGAGLTANSDVSSGDTNTTIALHEPLAKLTWSPKSGRFLSASPEAERLWGCQPLSLIDVLPERTMPALIRLAALAVELARMPSAARSETLVFWTARGSQRWLCRMTANGQDHAIDIDIMDAEPRPAVPSAAVQRPAANAQRQGPSAEDALTLSEIAQQIRARIADPSAPLEATDRRSALVDPANGNGPMRDQAWAEAESDHDAMVQPQLGTMLLEFVRAPALLLDGPHWQINTAGLALFNETDRTTLMHRGGPLVVVQGLNNAVSALEEQGPITLGLTAHPRGRPPAQISAELQVPVWSCCILSQSSPPIRPKTISARLSFLRKSAMRCARLWHQSSVLPK
jgi:hypothetical protein